MGWLDPVECAAASECLESGNPQEAARLLLESPHREHRAARQLLLRTSAMLVDEAKGAYAKGELTVAWDLIESARRCASLQGEGAILREHIARGRAEAQKNKDWQKARLKRARAWADQGRLHSAVGHLAPLGDGGDAKRLQIDLEERLTGFERHVYECRECLNQQAFAAARAWLQKARELLPNDPEVMRLTDELKSLEPGRSIDFAIAQAVVAVDGRTKGFGLGHYALITPAADVIIGNPRGHGVHVPILANIHRKHALIQRRDHHYSIQPTCGRCEVRVNEHPVSDPQPLRDGDRLEFGICAWTFRLPVNDSGTAVLEQADVTGATAWMPDGSSFTRIILIDDRLSIRPNLPAHLVIPQLPCEGLTLSRREDQFVFEADGGFLSLAATGQDFTGSSLPLTVPSMLTIHQDMNERDLLGRAFAGLEAAESLTIEFKDPYRAAKPLT